MPSERLLVIDDSKEALDFLEEFLGNHGYTVLTACDGEEGLLRAQNENPDVILLDMRMPRVTGLEVVEALNREGRDIPIIFLTAHGSEELAVQAFRLGVYDYIPKPYEPQIVLEVIEGALRQVSFQQKQHQLNRANQALEGQMKRLHTLNAVARSITAVRDVGQIITRVVEAAAYLTQAEESSLMLLDESTGELVLQATKNSTQKTVQLLRVQVDDTMAQGVMDTGRPVLLTGAELKQIGTGYLANALLMVPLRSPEAVVFGVLMVVNKRVQRDFGERHLNLLSPLADFAAVAIDNASRVMKLREQKNKLEAILREAREGILVLDEHARVLFCNRVAGRAFDLGERDVEGRPVGELVRDPELLDLLTQPGETGAPARLEMSLTDGRTLDLHISAVEGVGQTVILHDITRFKELDRVKSGFVSAVSHDLRTPLTTIQGYIDLLRHVGPLTEQQKEFVRRAQNSVSTIKQLITDLVEIDYVETDLAFEMVALDLQPVIAEAVDELRLEAEAKEQRLQVHLPAGLPMLRGDARRLRRVVSNLVSNAVKYTPAGGTIVVEASETKDHITISVADDGLGIPAAAQPYVFDRYFRVEQPETRDIPGTGLGLSIVKSVVEKHGGRVWVESTPGEGSTFTLLLPKR